MIDELKELFLGKKPESMSYDSLVKEIKTNRIMLLVCLFIFVMVLLGVLQQRSELLSCWNGDVLSACRTALDNCNMGFHSDLVFNMS